MVISPLTYCASKLVASANIPVIIIKVTRGEDNQRKICSLATMQYLIILRLKDMYKKTVV